MKIILLVFCLFFAFFWADFLLSPGAEPTRNGVADFSEATAGIIPFNHVLHGDSLGLDCAACHVGSRSEVHAYLPSKKDCLDCHRLPLTENPDIIKLDSALQQAPEHPWRKKSILPEHVVFHHGVHSAAGVNCIACHGNMEKLEFGNRVSVNSMASVQQNLYGGEHFDMKSCLACHRGESFREFKAATYCGACHR